MALDAQAARLVIAGETGELGLAQLAPTAQRLIVLGITLANAIGASVVIALLYGVLPQPEEAREADIALTAVVGGVVYLVAAIGVGTVWGLRRARPVIWFFEQERQAQEADRAAVLGLPAALMIVQATMWAGAVLVFGGLGWAVASALFAFEVAITITLGGITTSAIAFLVTQRLLRAAVDSVLADAPPRLSESAGVGTRAVMTWALGTALPVAGALTLAAFALGTDVDRDALARAVIALCVVALVFGLLATVLMARSIGEPLERLRDALADVAEGEYDVSVPVFDATELGYAASGFNRMVAGLQEREKLRDLFGRQVGEDVARQALEQGVTLGGEEREAAALFVDVIGSTGFAADREPGEVVEALNAFFAVVVAATLEHGGLVNKFAGDAALCIFGAPLSREDPAGDALRAARAMRDGLRGGVLDAGIGVSMGTVVAGNVGTADRYEYTVIGDPVNEAARLTDLAKVRPGRVLASEAAVAAAGSDEAERWALTDALTLRGRTRETRLAEPRA